MFVSQGPATMFGYDGQTSKSACDDVLQAANRGNVTIIGVRPAGSRR